MTVIESIMRDLQSLPMQKLVEVARYVHRMNADTQKERAQALRETHGYMSSEEAQVFEDALASSRRLKANA